MKKLIQKIEELKNTNIKIIINDRIQEVNSARLAFTKLLNLIKKFLIVI